MPIGCRFFNDNKAFYKRKNYLCSVRISMVFWQFSFDSMNHLTKRQLKRKSEVGCPLWLHAPVFLAEGGIIRMKSSELLWGSRFAFIFEAFLGLEEGVQRATRPMKGQKSDQKERWRLNLEELKRQIISSSEKFRRLLHPYPSSAHLFRSFSFQPNGMVT